MDNVKICLPKPENVCGGKNIKSFLKQLELCVHHAQKSVEEMESTGELIENTSLIYRFPFLENKELDGDSNMKVHIDELADQLQEVEIEIFTV